jgi:hypothetical protein
MSVTSYESVCVSVRSGFATLTRAATQRAAFFFIAMLSLAAAHAAMGATINYPDPPMGNTVLYTGVSETSITDALPLFGAPHVNGDSIGFNPTGFGAFAAGGLNDLTDGQIVFNVTAKAGHGIANISFSEAGTTSLTGLGTNATFTDVSATGELLIKAVDGVGISTIAVPIHLLFSPPTSAPGDPVAPNDPNFPPGNYPAGTSGTFRLVSDGQLSSLGWSGGETLNLSQVLTGYGVPFTLGATLISVDLDNGLIAQSEAGTLAFIEKKDFGGLAVTVNTPGQGGGPNSPEPASLVLAGLGFVGLGFGRRFLR